MDEPARRHTAPRLITVALGLARRGWFVFPLRPREKRPLSGFTHWEQRATRDSDRIFAWWSEAPYNIGVATGPSRLLVIDCDTARQPVPPPQWCNARCGLDVLKLLAEEAQQSVPATMTVRTPSGGTHLYFHAPQGRHLGNTAGKLGWLLDTRGGGGYVVAPGSVRRDGYYTITQDSEVAPLPAWLVAALTPKIQVAPLRQQAPDRQGSRYLEAVIAGETHRIVTATPGARNNVLNKAAFSLGQLVGGGHLSEDVAVSILSSAARQHIGIQHFTEAEITRTIASGLRAGKRCPRRSYQYGPPEATR